VTSAPLPDWFAKTLAVFNALSGWTLLAIALAGAAILCAPIRVGEVDLVQIRRDWGGWILAATILFGLLVLAKLGQRAGVSIARVWQRGAVRRARKEAEAETLAHLDTLSQEEWEILSECVSRGQRTYITSPMAPGVFGAVCALASKGLVESNLGPGVYAATALPYTIPPFVWDELQRRRENFLPVAKRRR
jgi:hypothetical protein